MAIIILVSEVVLTGARTAQSIVDSAMSNLRSMVNERLTGKPGGGGSGGGGKKTVWRVAFLHEPCLVCLFHFTYSGKIKKPMMLMICHLLY